MDLCVACNENPCTCPGGGRPPQTEPDRYTQGYRAGLVDAYQELRLLGVTLPDSADRFVGANIACEAARLAILALIDAADKDQA